MSSDNAYGTRKREMLTLNLRKWQSDRAKGVWLYWLVNSDALKKCLTEPDIFVLASGQLEGTLVLFGVWCYAILAFF